MKKFAAICLSAIFVCVSAIIPVVADEPPEQQREFAQKLRSRRMSDLALAFLEKLEADPVAKMQSWLPLEIARTQVSLAREAESANRTKLLADARKGLEKYAAALKKGTPEAAQLKAEISRVTYYEAQALLNLAFRQVDTDIQSDFAKKAEAKFEEAKIQFAGAKDKPGAIQALKEAADKYKDADPEKEKLLKTQLHNDWLQAKFDLARIHIDQARSYMQTSKTAIRLKRAKLIQLSKKMLNEIAEEGKAGTDQKIPALAYAWMIYIFQELEEPEAAVDYYKKIMLVRKALPESAAPGVRWAVYFFIQVLHKHPNPPIPKGYSKNTYILTLGQGWMNEFPAYKTTAAGHGISFEMGNSYLQLALQKSKDVNDPIAKKLYNKALEYFESVANSDSDLAEQANQLIFPIRIKMIGEDTKIASLKNFDECVIKARFEMHRLAQISSKLSQENVKIKKDKLKKEQKAKFGTIVSAFRRSLDIATFKTPPNKINDARYFLAYIYLLSGDVYRAAVMGEFLARRDPPTKQSPLAASYAIQAYKSIVELHNLEGNRKKLRDLLSYVLDDRKNEWHDEPVYPTATYELAMIALREKKYDETIKFLQKLPKDYRAYTFAQAQLALTALNAKRKAEEAKKPKKAKYYEEKALVALNAIRTLPKNPDSATSQMFFVAQIEHGKLMFTKAANLRQAEKQKEALTTYREMANFCGSLHKQFETVKVGLEDEAQEQLGDALKALLMYSRLGLGELEYQAGQYDKVLAKEMTGQTVAEVEALGKKEKRIALKDYQVAGELVGLAMRANVQKGNIARAQELLNLLQRLGGPDGKISDPTLPLKKLIADLNSQVKVLKNDKAKLKAFSENFTNFFDAMLKAKGVKNLDRNTIFFLARSYQIMDRYGKAADLYGKIEKPAAFDPKTPLSKAEQKKLKEMEASATAYVTQQKQNAKAEIDRLKKAIPQAKTKEEKAELKDNLGKAEKVFQRFASLDPAGIAKQAREDLDKSRKAEHTKKEQLWWLIQVFRAEVLRKATKLDESEKLLDMVLKDKKSVGKLRANKEKVHLLEDRKLFGTAITKWSNLMQNRSLRAAIRNDPKMKEFYFDCYYHFVWCWYKYSQAGGKKFEQKYLKRGADYIVRLENAQNKEGWQLIGMRFEKLLRDAPQLKAAYDQLKKENQAGGN